MPIGGADVAGSSIPLGDPGGPEPAPAANDLGLEKMAIKGGRKTFCDIQPACQFVLNDRSSERLRARAATCSAPMPIADFVVTTFATLFVAIGPNNTALVFGG